MTEWYARVDIFPKLKPLVDLWVRALMPIFLVVLMFHSLFGKRLNISIDWTFYLTIFGFVLFYIFGVSAMSIFWTRFLTPLTPLMVVLDYIGFTHIGNLSRKPLLIAKR